MLLADEKNEILKGLHTEKKAALNRQPCSKNI